MSTRGYENFTATDVARHALKHAKQPIAGATGRSDGRSVGRSKFGAVKTTVDGVTFDSAKEANHYRLLKMRQRAGQIDSLELQPVYEIYIARGLERIHIGNYRPDFQYWENTPNGARFRVDEVKGGKGRKGTRTEAYRLRKKLVEAIYSIQITEI